MPLPQISTSAQREKDGGSKQGKLIRFLYLKKKATTKNMIPTILICHWFEVFTVEKSLFQLLKVFV